MGALRHRASLLQVTQQGNHKSLSRRHVNVKHDQIGGIKRRISLLVAALSLLMMFAHAARADPKPSDQPAAAQIDADQDPEYDGLDITRPQNRFDLHSQDQTSAPQIKLLKKPKCCGSVNASIFRRCGNSVQLLSSR